PLSLWVVPLAVAAVLGIYSHFLLPRTLSAFAWAPLVGLAALVDGAARRWRPLGLAAGGLVAMLVAPSVGPALHDRPPPAAALARVEAVARPGDAVAIHPHWLHPLVAWHLGVHRRGPEAPLSLAG